MSSLTGSVKDWHVPWKHQRTMPPLENIVKRSNISWRIIPCKFRFKVKSYSQNASQLHQRFNFDPRLPLKGFEKVRRCTYSHEFSCCLRSCNSCDTTCERPTLRIFPIIPSTTTTLLLRMYSLRALALSGEVLRTTHSLSFAGRCNNIDQLFFRWVFFNLRHGLSPNRGTNCSLAHIKRL